MIKLFTVLLVLFDGFVLGAFQFYMDEVLWVVLCSIWYCVGIYAFVLLNAEVIASLIKRMDEKR